MECNRGSEKLQNFKMHQTIPITSLERSEDGWHRCVTCNDGGTKGGMNFSMLSKGLAGTLLPQVLVHLL